MVVHLWGKFWMAAWRGGRTRVWITGAITFLVAVPTAFTGYVSQQNFDAQWIATQAKDGLNSVGVGAFFNVTNFGQMYSYHVFLLPLAVVGLVVGARAARSPPRRRPALSCSTGALSRRARRGPARPPPRAASPRRAPTGVAS